MNAIHRTPTIRGSRFERQRLGTVRLMMLLAPLFVSACMLPGMGGMGMHGSDGMHEAAPPSVMRDPATVKELVAQGMRITVNFPSYAVGDALAYDVSLRDARDETRIRDASVFLVVTPDGATKLAATISDSGTYVFRPALTTEGAYRLVVVVERTGATILDPPVRVEHTVRLEGRVAHRSTSGQMTAGIAPVVLIGAAAMAIMMLFVFR